jgi:transcriptional antiterminator RfaH
MSFWAVAQIERRMQTPCKGRPNSLLEYILQRAGYETYLPRLQLRRHGVTRNIPLFPSYIFVRVVDRWYPITSSPGVIRLLMNGDRPAALIDSALDLIRGKERGGFVRLPRGTAKGDQVRVLGGQFVGHIGLYDGQTSHERERVLLELLGRSVRVELGRNDRVEATS